MANHGGKIPRWARQVRPSVDARGEPLPGTTVGYLLAATTIRHVELTCHVPSCGHRAYVPIEGLLPETVVERMGGRARCSRCGIRGETDSRPDWREDADRVGSTGLPRS